MGCRNVVKLTSSPLRSARTPATWSSSVSRSHANLEATIYIQMHQIFIGTYHLDIMLTCTRYSSHCNACRPAAQTAWSPETDRQSSSYTDFCALATSTHYLQPDATRWQASKCFYACCSCIYVVSPHSFGTPPSSYRPACIASLHAH